MRLVRLIAVYYSNATRPPSKIFFGSVSGRPVGMSTRGLKLNPSVDGPARAPGVPSLSYSFAAPLLYIAPNTPLGTLTEYSSYPTKVRIFFLSGRGLP